MITAEIAERYERAALDFALLYVLADPLRRIGKQIKTMQYQATFRIKRDKIVSDADIFAQKSIRGCIKKYLPHAVIIAEEGFRRFPRDVKTLHLVFVVDPIDGTRYFLSGKDEWAISIGIYEYGVLTGAIVLQPAVDECFVALAGHGVRWRTGTRAWRKHARQRAPRPLIGVSTSVSVANVEHNWNLARLVTREFRGVCSAPTVVAFLEVLRGRSDACVMLYKPRIWDIAAILLLSQESGMLVACDNAAAVSDRFCREPNISRLLIAANKAAFMQLRFIVGAAGTE